MRVPGTPRPGSGPDDEFVAAQRHYDDRAYYGRTYDRGQYYDRAYDRGQYYDRAYDNGAPSAHARTASLPVRTGRVVSGVVAGAVLVMATVVLGAQYLSGERGFPGPGSVSVAAHVAAAVAVVLAQIVADRKKGLVSIAASGVVIVTASILLATQWWG
ncbi:hypothetical protein ACIBED_16225 [Rhodococcus coprophilus]|uniref:Hypothetical membrane protein n=1 Tax=Rhodococcus coprophilus TaxID=38310 RepID=A0A2X4TTI2_9NOCA|nr:hypothetical protein [Rhodococcus coprophilus]MBM7457649.1 hypothetical protein [Rhodococcus coprophilus]SQI30133.1 hypothetical membrane protein [Rhodococcus coprophilus]